MRLLVLVAAAVAGACSSADPIDMPTISGDYTATEYVTFGPSDGAADVIAAGGYLRLSFDKDGSVRGVGLVPSSSGAEFTHGSGEFTVEGSYDVFGDSLSLSLPPVYSGAGVYNASERTITFKRDTRATIRVKLVRSEI